MGFCSSFLLSVNFCPVYNTDSNASERYLRNRKMKRSDGSFETTISKKQFDLEEIAKKANLDADDFETVVLSATEDSSGI